MAAHATLSSTGILLCAVHCMNVEGTHHREHIAERPSMSMYKLTRVVQMAPTEEQWRHKNDGAKLCTLQEHKAPV